jgi:molecular chaperone GrpE
MSYYYDPYGRRRQVRDNRQQAGSAARRPTLDDYTALEQANQQLQAQVQQQSKELAEKQRELEIQREALRRHSTDTKAIEAELMWAKAAIQQTEARDDDSVTWQERYQKLQQEVDSLRKRWEQRFEVESAEAKRQILRDMVPLADHLELALRHVDAAEELTREDFRRNVDAVLRAFLETLKRYGVEPIQAVGEPFDPNLHEAVGQVDQGRAPGEVLQVVQTGYRAGEGLLRPARVIIQAETQHAGPQP